VHRLEHEAVPNTQRLVGRLDRELVLVVGIAMLEQVDALEAQIELRVGLRAPRALGGRSLSRRAAAPEAPIDDRAFERSRRVLALVRGRKLGRITEVHTGLGTTRHCADEPKAP